MNTTNTNTLQTYPQVQAIEPTDNMKYQQKMINRYSAMFFITFAAGMLTTITITPAIGVPLCFSALIFVFMWIKHSSNMSDFPEEKSFSDDTDETGPLGWSVSSPFHSSYYGSISRD